MGIQKGLNAIKAYNEEIERRKEAAEAGKINWLKMEDGESVEMRFLQELDESALNYSEKNGLGFFATEHTKPGKQNFMVKALCSADDEEKCLGCEEHKKDWKAGWKAKSRLYINVLVRRKDGTEEVAVLSQPNGPKAVIAKMVLDYAVENNTITDRWWKITRNGTDEATTYTPFVRNPVDDVNPEDYEVFDLDRAVRKVTYAEQQAFFFGTAEKDAEPEEAPSGSTSSFSKTEW